MVYNNRPFFRSVLSAVQLLAIARAEDIHTYGCDPLLQPFVDHIKLLSEVHLLFLLLNLTVFRIMVVNWKLMDNKLQSMEQLCAFVETLLV